MSDRSSPWWQTAGLCHYDTTVPDWTPFYKSAAQPDPTGTVYGNSRYTVIVRYEESEADGVTGVHLSIHDHMRTARHDWRDFQRIKNELLGHDWELIEVYPAESRLVDTSNEYHLWGWKQNDTPCPVLVGFRTRFVGSPDDPYFQATSAKQRPWRKGEQPEDAVPDLASAAARLLRDMDVLS